jgi:hypothetical protein
VDITRDIIFEDYTLNDEDISDAITGGGGIGTGITGCVIDSVDDSDVDIVQFVEKRSQGDGMDAGDVFKGMRRIRMGGTLYAATRALFFDALADLTAALDPVLAQRAEPLDRGYRPLYFSVPTNRIDDFPLGAIDMRYLAMPRSFSCPLDRDGTGGSDDDALAIPWQATFICKNPSKQGASPVDTNFTVQTLVTGATGQNAGDTITKNSHGLVNGDRVRFITLTGGTGLATTITYYVVNKAANTFQVSLTLAGAAVAITADYSTVTYVKSATDSGTLNNRGTYLAAVEALWVVGAGSGTITATIGDSIFTLTIPASTGARTIRFKGSADDKMVTIEEDSVEVPRLDVLAFTGDTTWPLIDPGDSAYSFTTHGLVQATGSHFWFYETYA